MGVRNEGRNGEKRETEGKIKRKKEEGEREVIEGKGINKRERGKSGNRGGNREK